MEEIRGGGLSREEGEVLSLWGGISMGFQEAELKGKRAIARGGKER